MHIEAHLGGCRCVLDQRRMSVHFQSGDDWSYLNSITCGCMTGTVTQISYKTGGGLAVLPLDLSQSMWGRGAEKEAVQALCREDFDSLFSLPLPGPCYLIHNPSLNCEHRCFPHPQPELFIQSADDRFNLRSTITSDRKSKARQRGIHHYCHSGC